MSELLNFVSEIDLTNYTLIIPSVSVGNAAQLTVDLIISTYNLKKVATIWHPAIIPSVGADPFSKESKDICTACELYANSDLKIGVIQLRSALDGKYRVEFLKDLQENISKLKFKNVVILTTSFAYEMHDVNSSKYRYITNDFDDQTLTTLGIIKMECSEGGDYVIHGSGFALKLYNVLSEHLKSTIIIKYTSEGDNRPDALQILDLLQRLISVLDLKGKGQIKFPMSWDHVFGNPPPTGIY